MAAKKTVARTGLPGARPRVVRGSPVAGPSMCACSPGTQGTGHRATRRAVHVDPSIKSVNLTQLRRIEGQVRGIASMIEDERYCTDIITQIAAVRESLHTVAKNLMKNHVTHCASVAMSAGGGERDAMIAELLGLVGKLAR